MILDPADQPGADMLIIELADRVQLWHRCRQRVSLPEGPARCRAPADYAFRWPGGAGYSPICGHHCAWAWWVAHTMGFELDHKRQGHLGERLTDDPETRRFRLLEVD